MGTFDVALHSLNAGVVSRKGLARVDLTKMRIAAEVQENLLPTVLGPAIFRPGTGFITRTHDDGVPTGIPFVFNAAVKALLEITNSVVRIIVDDVPLTRPSVTSSITNGTFDSDLTGWTDDDESGASSAFVSGGYMGLTGTGSNYAIRRQEVTVSGGNVNVEHALRIVVARGPVTLRVGSSSGADDYIAETLLGTGEHSLAFTPSGNFHIALMSRSNLLRLVDSIVVESSGIVTLASPWSTDHQKIKVAQSADVLFCAVPGYQQRRIERRSQRSWSISLYQANDGPFKTPNTSQTTIAPSAVAGSVTLTASRPIFKPGHVGSIWRLTHSGQTATATLSGADQFTDPIRVTGINDNDVKQRPFTVRVLGVTGTSTTVTLQRSFDEVGSWEDVSGEAYTTNQNKTYDDGLDNQIVFYRLGIKSGDYSSGSITATLIYSGSIQRGIARVTAYSSETSVSAEVLQTFGRASATSNWSAPVWSGYDGYPSAVEFHDGRLWWGFQDKVYGSVSDAFDSYSDQVEGDSAPVVRSVATGPFEGILSLLSLQRLVGLCASQEVSMRASSLDEPITATQFTARTFAQRGAANIQAVKVDSRGAYVQRSLKRVFEIVYSFDAQDYESRDLTRLCPDLLAAGVVGMAVQRQPDTRIWLWLADGTAAVCTYEPSDEVVAWTPVTTASGDLIKNIVVLPGADEDDVYWAVQRTNSGSGFVAWEKLAKLSEAVGGTLSKTMDCAVVYTGSATTTIPVGTHLNGRSLVVWANGAPLTGTFTVSGGNITLPSAMTNVVAGLGYEGKFKSTKLAYGGPGTALSKQKRIDHMALLMADVSWSGIRVGRDFTNMTGLPATRNNGPALTAGLVIPDYDYVPSPIDGGWLADARACFKISSPHCATFMGLVLSQQTSPGLTQPTRQAAAA